jgi:hypothetical protein
MYTGLPDPSHVQTDRATLADALGDISEETATA